MLSRAYKLLSSARALQKSVADLVKSVTELDQEVDIFRRSVDHIISLDKPLDLMHATSTMPNTEAIMVYFLYYGLLLDIHHPLMVPWSGSSSVELQSFQIEVERSCSIVASTARQAILASRFVQLNASSIVM